MATSQQRVNVRRIYEPPEQTDGTRVLVDRLWPRGVSKERAHLDLWLKAVAPSSELREWYGHVPERFDEFAARYRDELRDTDRAAAFSQLRELSTQGALTLLTASRAVEISEATVLATLLRTQDGT